MTTLEKVAKSEGSVASMPGQAVRQAADILWDHWVQGRQLAQLPEHLRPQTRSDGYAIQATFESRSHAPLYGWKIAATSEAAQRHLQIDGPTAGRILAERAFGDGHTLSLAGNTMRVIEPEFAFRMRQGLPRRDRPYGIEEVIDAVDTLHPAIEVPNSRFEDSRVIGAAQFIADNSCAHEFVLGPPASQAWRGLDLAKHHVDASVVGKLQRSGSGAAVLGNPLAALRWLANELASIGTPLKPGEVIASGTCAKPLPVAPGDEVFVDFGSLGRVSLRAGA